MAIPISSASDLYNIRNNLSGEYYLTNDIDLSSYDNWEPIGDWDSGYFTGTLDGKGYNILNLKVNRDYSSGLFEQIENATIKNIGFKNANIVANFFGGIIAGGIYETSIENILIESCNIDGYNDGDLESTHLGLVCGELWNEGDNVTDITIKNSAIETEGEFAGLAFGFLGGNNLSVSDIVIDEFCKITALDYYVGGIAAYTGGENHKYNHLISKATVRMGSGFGCGGLFGELYAQNSIMSECCFEGKVLAENSKAVGGISGNIQRNHVIENCYVAGRLTASSSLGGIGGTVEDTTINNCYVAVTRGATATPAAPIIGSDYGGNNVTNTYYDSQLFLDLEDEFGIAKTTSEMKRKSTFKNWDFENVWIKKYDDYPKLRAFEKPDTIAIPLKALLSNINIAR